MKKVIDDVVFLKGRRLYMRPMTKADIPRYLRWRNDPEVRQYLGAYLPTTEAGLMKWMDASEENKEKEVILIIVDLKSAKPIGVMGLHGIHPKDRTATTGAMIGEKSFWGRGYGSEAKMFLLDYAFHQLNLRKICSQVISFNKRSEAYSKKCGYQSEGVLKLHLYKNGQHWDVHNLAVFKEGWLPLWEKFRKANRIK